MKKKLAHIPQPVCHAFVVFVAISQLRLRYFLVKKAILGEILLELSHDLTYNGNMDILERMSLFLACQLLGGNNEIYTNIVDDIRNVRVCL